MKYKDKVKQNIKSWYEHFIQFNINWLILKIPWKIIEVEQDTSFIKKKVFETELQRFDLDNIKDFEIHTLFVTI